MPFVKYRRILPFLRNKLSALGLDWERVIAEQGLYTSYLIAEGHIPLKDYTAHPSKPLRPSTRKFFKKYLELAFGKKAGGPLNNLFHEFGHGEEYFQSINLTPPVESLPEPRTSVGISNLTTEIFSTHFIPPGLTPEIAREMVSFLKQNLEKNAEWLLKHSSQPKINSKLLTSLFNAYSHGNELDFRRADVLNALRTHASQRIPFGYAFSASPQAASLKHPHVLFQLSLSPEEQAHAFAVIEQSKRQAELHQARLGWAKAYSYGKTLVISTFQGGVSGLPANLRKRYEDWSKILLRHAEDYARKNGFKEIRIIPASVKAQDYAVFGLMGPSVGYALRDMIPWYSELPKSSGYSLRPAEEMMETPGENVSYLHRLSWLKRL